MSETIDEGARLRAALEAFAASSGGRHVVVMESYTAMLPHADTVGMFAREHIDAHPHRWVMTDRRTGGRLQILPADDALRLRGLWLQTAVFVGKIAPDVRSYVLSRIRPRPPQGLAGLYEEWAATLAPRPSPEIQRAADEMQTRDHLRAEQARAEQAHRERMARVDEWDLLPDAWTCDQTSAQSPDHTEPEKEKPRNS